MTSMRDFIGVNGGLSDKGLDQLAELGVRHVRGNLPPALSPRQLDAHAETYHMRWLRAGNALSLIANMGDHRTHLTPALVDLQVEQMLQLTPQALGNLEVEGPNEINNWTHGADAVLPSGQIIHDKPEMDTPEHEKGVTYPATLWNMTIAHHLLSARGVPLKGVVGIGAGVVESCDISNVHIYSGGRDNAAATAANVKTQKTKRPDAPIDATEMGYALKWVHGSETEQARLIVKGIENAREQGIRRVYVYAVGGVFGLFNDDGTPREAAKAVRDLIAAG